MDGDNTDTATQTVDAPAQPDSAPSPLEQQAQQARSSSITPPTDTPFDSLFKEGALDGVQDKGVADWIAKQKNGEGIQKGLRGLINGISSKGFEVPDENADEKTIEKFNQHKRHINGVPEKPEDYEFEVPDGFEAISDELKEQIRKNAFEAGLSPDHLQAFIKQQAEITLANHNKFLESQSEKMAEIFGDDLETVEPKMQEYIQSQGFDINDPAFRNADTWKLVHQNMLLTEKIKNITGEDTIVTDTSNASTSNSHVQALEKEVADLANDPQVRKPRYPADFEKQKQYLAKHKELSAARARMRG